jgi:hypothetical protein
LTIIAGSWLDCPKNPVVDKGGQKLAKRNGKCVPGIYAWGSDIPAQTVKIITSTRK